MSVYMSVYMSGEDEVVLVRVGVRVRVRVTFKANQEPTKK